MVFYRKYRPQTIHELDSQEVREKLTSFLSKDSFHALFFTGPKGLGKTSAARIVAKILNCERLVDQRSASSLKEKKLNTKRYTLRTNIEPCNKCDQCISITNGSNIDVLEIDGASNRGIDEIRDLREKIKLSSARARKKVYIIDEVHMLTTEAFNALLKTLEEPPSHVVFILCTTEPHKVPATISSRCFHISFKRATPKEFVRAFSRISKKEKISTDSEALLEIARLSDGSFRDGVKILEEAFALSGKKKITKDFIQKTHQTSDIGKSLEDMTSYLIDRNAKGSVRLIGELAEKGADMKYFLESLISRLHEILLIKVGVLDMKEEMADKIELSELKELIEVLSIASGKIKYAVLPQLPLEIAVIEWSLEPEQNFSSESTHLARDARRADSKSTDITRSLSERGLKSNSLKSSGSSFSSLADGQTSSSKKNDILTELIDKVKVGNHSIAGFLRGCAVKDLKKGKLTLEAKFQFHKDKLEERETKRVIEDVLKKITGKETKVDFVLK